MAQPISPIRVSANGRYFTDGQGRPLFWLGDTQWELFRLFDAATARRILRQRQERGFNVILIMLLGVDMTRAGRPAEVPHQNLEGRVPWVEGDPLRPDEAYFRHIDGLVRLGEETGQTLVVGVYHQWQVEAVPVEKARPWARWVARRYRDVPNLIWSMYPRAEAGYAPVCRELAAGLREGDGGAHLISVHPDPAVASSSFLHGEDWLAFNMIQTCTQYDRIGEAVAADYQRRPVKPVVMAEGGYEGLEFGRLQTARQIRQQAWWTHLAGGHHVYGHNDAWTAPQAWEAWLDSPGARSLEVYRRIATGAPEWWDLVPDPSLLAPSTGRGFEASAAARSASGAWAMAYAGAPGRLGLRLDEVSGRRRAWWVCPATGQRHPVAVPEGAGVLAASTPAGWEDALLLVQGE